MPGLGRPGSELPLLHAAIRHDPDLPMNALWRLKALATGDSGTGSGPEGPGDVAAARLAVRALVARLAPATRPADIRDYNRLEGSEIHTLDRLEALLTPGVPVHSVPGRLLYVLHHSRPQLSNGYAIRGHGLACGMRAAGIDLHCLTRPGFPLDVVKEIETAPEFDVVDGIPYLRALGPKRSGPGRSLRYLQDAADALEARIREIRPQAVMAASNYVAALPALIAARRAGLPFVYEVRGFWEITKLSRDAELRMSFEQELQKALETATARAADHVFTLSASMARELVGRGVAAERIGLLPNSCDPGQFHARPRDATLAARLALPAEVPVIGYIGSFVDYEGLDDLTEACALLRRRGTAFRLLLVGADAGPVHDRIREIAREQGLEDWLILPGRVPPEEVEAWYSLIDIAPFPRKPLPVTEVVTPLKPLEAMAMEKAVVMSSVEAMREMVEDGATGLVFQKGDIGDLAEKLGVLVQDGDLRLALGKAAREFVAAERTWAKMGERVREWLEGETPISSTNHP